ncbi:Kynureninase (L-kynurenine hydrolase) [Tulasnella sp. 418]|nr:Kynureninase (L-kynurenine hydrolase) [Tulasnella sp. 418]
MSTAATVSTINKLIGEKVLTEKDNIADSRVATQLDSYDPLRKFREDFLLPTHKGIKATEAESALQDAACTYFVGNSLGPLAKRSKELLEEELAVWASTGVNGHFAHPHDRNWMTIAHKATRIMASIVGAEETEVACMGTLTANLHLMMTSFYKPTQNKYKILCEYHAFPSDQYAFASQVQLHGFDPKDAIIEMKPREGEFTLREEDILTVIKDQGPSIALVLFSGIQYYTGQLFPMASITRAAKEQNCICGWDLAHAVGNVPLRLNAWGVDFAVWCTYKYLNSGPGGIGGLFINKRWTEAKKPMLAGWWGHDEATRFEMPPTFLPIPGAQGFQQSNPSALNVVTLLGSLQIFEAAGGMGPIRLKSEALTAYLEALLHASPNYVKSEELSETKKHCFTIITPSELGSRGAQLSLLFRPKGIMPQIFEGMIRRGVIGDERNPDVIRLAPIPLYCTFHDCLRAVKALDDSFSSLK